MKTSDALTMTCAVLLCTQQATALHEESKEPEFMDHSNISIFLQNEAMHHIMDARINSQKQETSISKIQDESHKKKGNFQKYEDMNPSILQNAIEFEDFEMLNIQSEMEQLVSEEELIHHTFVLPEINDTTMLSQMSDSRETNISEENIIKKKSNIRVRR
eukprot:CAMPEP_0194368648 /NCGR_PEP_ID=MMETSP0174-20130528/16840_1 /TAXON_ID=216777 /ORGANISM="Proboscia alata, Strain PI-D3" /LENGTH=159 /DNA_ID=CAMNT_0039145079 /DNA_START=98 /DNA_END=577 /DNA_ORIENTATION=+